MTRLVYIHADRNRKVVPGQNWSVELIENLHVTYTEVIQRESVTARVHCVQGRGLLSLDRAFIVAP